MPKEKPTNSEVVETPDVLKARLKKAPEKPKEEPKPEPKKTKVRVAKAKKYEDLPEIPDYERADLEIYEKTEMDELERQKKMFEPPQIRVPEDEKMKEVESKRKGSYQRGAANENGAPEKGDAALRKGSLRPINEDEPMAPPTLKAVPPPAIIEVCSVLHTSNGNYREEREQIQSTIPIIFVIDPRRDRYQRKRQGECITTTIEYFLNNYKLRNGCRYIGQ